MEFVDRFQAFVRNVSVVFEKPKQERSKCPRCKGSGLLAHKGLGWDQRPVSNDPCWFCEGIGVMPVAGLSGFMFGRASSMFQTRDIVTRARLPIKTQLCLGKFPGTRPKFVTYKPSEKVENLLHDFSAAPVWSLGETYSIEGERAEESQEVEARPPLLAREISSRSPMMSSARNKQNSSGLRTKSNQNLRSAPRLSRQLGNRSSPRSANSSGSASRVVTPNGKRVSEWAAVSLAPKLSRSTPKVTANFRTSTHSLPPTDQQPKVPRPETVSCRKPLLKCSKAVKVPRRGRNRIREEVERAAAERARRVHGGGSLPDVGPTPTVAPGTPRNENNAVASSPLSNKAPLLPWLEPSKALPLSDYSWVNDTFFGKFKQRTPPPPSLSSKLFL